MLIRRNMGRRMLRMRAWIIWMIRTSMSTMIGGSTREIVGMGMGIAMGTETGTGTGTGIGTGMGTRGTRRAMTTSTSRTGSEPRTARGGPGTGMTCGSDF